MLGASRREWQQKQAARSFEGNSKCGRESVGPPSLAPSPFAPSHSHKPPRQHTHGHPHSIKLWHTFAGKRMEGWVDGWME